MSLPSMDDCADCTPKYLLRRLDSAPSATIIWSLIPFILTWIAMAGVAHYRLFPILSNTVKPQKSDSLPQFKTDPFKTTGASGNKRLTSQMLARLVFATSIGLSAVLVELLLCEISDTLHPAARALALRVTLGGLLILSLLVTPALELHGFVSSLTGAPSDDASTRRKTKRQMRLIIEAALFGGWLLAFWYLPQTSILRSALDKSTKSSVETDGYSHAFTQACLERVGIIGIALMASLSGFAAISSLFQTFGVRHRIVSASDLLRKEEGLRATESMLEGKQSRLRALQRKMSEPAAGASSSPSTSSPISPLVNMGRSIAGAFRGASSDVQEVKALQLEISGLETMRYHLSSFLSSLRNQHETQQLSRTARGRALALANTVFACYCAYRILSASVSSIRRFAQPDRSFATADPINNFLALLTTHWDSDLDRAAWSRQISFLLSGVMLLASFNAVLQTFRLFSRFTPMLHFSGAASLTSLPLIISQVAGTYVISSALLLRSNLPEEVGGVISEALGAPLEARFVEGWFESWFLVAVVVTGMGVVVGRKVGGTGDYDDDDVEGMEMGKRS
ncbi:hypothetical protein LTR56_002819 [Elasticomyces elasticus]|nr:hypothetical protein LTR56_002819 [Elasticomyces elasticus]KAK3666724.1 hypothetical protein LTR22_002311 [Elasticomyces elasticus]KAK4920434.1 hypothetical protein LTR49_012026 [Elasticomyces elasticus]KAK5759279.1 hypothetical protein LTS12_010602 [Elasticomyces elasticus]